MLKTTEVVLWQTSSRYVVIMQQTKHLYTVEADAFEAQRFWFIQYGWKCFRMGEWRHTILHLTNTHQQLTLKCKRS